MSDINETFGFSAPETAQEKTPDARPRVRVGTIVWGLILVVIAAFYAANAVVDLDAVDGWKVITWGALALGAVFVVGGLAAAAARNR